MPLLHAVLSACLQAAGLLLAEVFIVGAAASPVADVLRPIPYAFFAGCVMSALLQAADLLRCSWLARC
jgi:hypothetical protein